MHNHVYINAHGSRGLYSLMYICIRHYYHANTTHCSIQKAGAAYAEIEVMKMFMPVTVKESGIIHWCISEGATLKPGDRLATLQLDDPSAVNKVSTCMILYMKHCSTV
jgi:Biotin-requiring enzyme